MSGATCKRGSGRGLLGLPTKLTSSALVAANAGVSSLTERGLLVELGGSPDPQLLSASPQYHDGRFHNAKALHVAPGAGDVATTVREFVTAAGERSPAQPIPLVPWQAPTTTGVLAVTWYGHASALVEIGTARVLVDPVWSRRASPSRMVGPRRMHPPPHRLTDVGELDAVVISHDHYDHLDRATVQELAGRQRAPFVVPLGVGAHLRRWGVPEQRIVELDWHEQVRLDRVQITATPAQHFSGRGLSRNTTLWASWVLAGPDASVFYSGDSGYFAGFRSIGDRYGPFDASLMQIGAYNVSWPDIHMTPEEGVTAHRDVRAGLLIPVHWATFDLAPHPWSEPPNRLVAEAAARGVDVVVPRPGERFTVAQPPAVDAWWRAIA